MPDSLLNCYSVNQLLTFVEEAARSTDEGIKRFIEPAPGTLSRVISKRHHLVFGRRGTGKSSLLRKAVAQLSCDRAPVALVNLESFKGHSYPDVLISVLIETLQKFNEWINTTAIAPTTKKNFWMKYFGRKPTNAPHNAARAKELSTELTKWIDKLSIELHKSDDAEIKAIEEKKQDDKESYSIGVKIAAHGAGIGGGCSSSTTEASLSGTEERFKRSKTDYLHRNILEFQKLFSDLAEFASKDAFLFLDDLYHIKRTDQAAVVDFFHRVGKDHKLWLKIGTIKHRTTWYIHGNPPTGMKLSDDADEIDLDLTLEKYALAKDFLKKILTNFAREASLSSLDNILTDGALDRLVLASGGVARDFLAIFRKSVDCAREHEGGNRGDKVGVEDVNRASGEFDSTKRQDFTRDTLDDTSPLLEAFGRIRDFCLIENEINCFLIEKEIAHPDFALIHELVDLKFLHLVRSRVTVSARSGRIFEAYMLDLSQYAGERKRRGLDIVKFWEPNSNDALRKASIIYSPA